MMRAAAALLILLAAGPVSAQAPGSQECQRELFFTDGALKATANRLRDNANAPQAQQCAIWRRHVEVMRKASAVFARCTTGRERAENVGQMDGSVADFQEVIASRCGAPGRPAPAEPQERLKPVL